MFIRSPAQALAAFTLPIAFVAVSCSSITEQDQQSTETSAATTGTADSASASAPTSSLAEPSTSEGKTSTSPAPSSTEASTPTTEAVADQGILVDGDYRLYFADATTVDLVWRDAEDRPLGQLEQARRLVESETKTVRLALNAGLYQPGLIPAGLHIEDGVELVPINLNEGAGNFHLMPNGVFFIDDSGANVQESNAFVAANRKPRLAVQSGPMLTIDGAIHPAFNASSESRFVRNGVGVTDDGQIVFIQSTAPVTLWDFADMFLSHGATNSLYLDGSIARMEVPIEGRPIFPNVPFAAMLIVTD